MTQSAAKTGTPASDINFEAARKRVVKDLEEPEWNQQFEGLSENLATSGLTRFLKSEMRRGASMDILRQCTVLTWGAFEVLCSDLFRHLTNNNPKLAALLLKNERTKKFYQAKDLIVALEEHDYNLCCTMGDVLLDQCRLDKLSTIRTIYDVLFSDNEELRTALTDERLWQLYQIRNLIVRRAAKIDDHFRKKTGLNAPRGEKLRIAPHELKDFIILSDHAGLALLNAAEAA